MIRNHRLKKIIITITNITIKKRPTSQTKYSLSKRLLLR